MSHVMFTPSTSITAICGGAPGRFAMPPVDPINPDTVLTNTGSLTVWVRLGGEVGSPPWQVGPGQPGTIEVKAGLPLMLTSKADVVEAVGLHRALNDGGGSAAATSFTLLGQPGMPYGLPKPGPAGLTVTRGTASAQMTF